MAKYVFRKVESTLLIIAAFSIVVIGITTPMPPAKADSISERRPATARPRGTGLMLRQISRHKAKMHRE